MNKQKIAKELVKIAKQLQSSRREEYQKYFNGIMDKYNIDTPSDLNEQDKKKFFDEVDKGWKGENEKPEKKASKVAVLLNKRHYFQVKVDDFDGEVLNPKDTNLEIYVWEEDKPMGACFSGRSSKPMWSYKFRNKKQRQDYIDQTVEQRLKKIEDKRKRKQEDREFQHDFKKGDILYASWGYDQTNIDFYQVTDVRGKMIVVREVASKIVDSKPPQDYVVPVKNKFIGSPIRKKVLKGHTSGGDGYIKLSSFEYAYKWDGEPKYQTSSGWGH